MGFLEGSPLQMWAFILIVVIGSICLLATGAAIIRCVVVRQRAQVATVDEYAAPMRKVTVRRGRVVPQSHYLSLTGSKFGLNEFEADDKRSKSPFEWLSKVNKKQNDEMSQRGSVYGKKEFATSTNNLPTPEKQTPVVIRDVRSPTPTALPSPIPSPNHSPLPSPNRSHFARPLHSTSGSFFQDKRLTMIEEASPHTSIISASSKRRSSKMTLTPFEGNLTRQEQRRPSYSTTSTPSPYPSRNASKQDLNMQATYHGSTMSDQTKTQMSYRSPAPSNQQIASRHDSGQDYHESRRGSGLKQDGYAEPRRSSGSQPHRSSNQSTGSATSYLNSNTRLDSMPEQLLLQQGASRRSSGQSTRTSQSNPNSSRFDSVPEQPIPQVQRPQQTYRSHIPIKTNSQRSYHPYQSHSQNRAQSQTKSPTAPRGRPQEPYHQNQRPDGHVQRSSSRKGKVLRKKSLKRASDLSMVQ